MSRVLISVKNVSKSFVLPKERLVTAKQVFLSSFSRKEKTTQKVLEGISFDVNEGDFLGIVGKNGSGKSTLLKLLAKIYVPDSGSIIINGNISPFLELGVGFNPELTGKENIYLNGALLGLSKEEIDRDIHSIIDFSELEEFMDQRLKNYSSGMQVRLAFSVAIHAHAPIVLLDEVLAVGDASFQRKCQVKFAEMKRLGRTVILVTHNMNDVRRYCNKAILIEGGRIVSRGRPEKVSNDYDVLNLSDTNSAPIEKDKRRDVEIESVELIPRGKKNILSYGDNFGLEIEIKKRLKKDIFINCSLSIDSQYGKCFDFSTYFDDTGFVFKKNKQTTRIIAKISNPNILPGEYSVTVSVFGKEPGTYYHFLESATYFKIVGEKKGLGVVFLDHEWCIDDSPLE